MSDQRDSDDAMQMISDKMQSITTIDSNTSGQEVRRSLNENKTPITPVSSPIPDDHSGHVIEMERKLPSLNLPEKILFVVDTVHEETLTPYKLSAGAEFQPLYLIKRAIEIFVGVKSTLKSPHEFALMTLNINSVMLNCPFTSAQNFLNSLNKAAEHIVQVEPEIYDIGLIFDKIHEQVAIPIVMDLSAPPPHVTRVILIYSRSNCIPTFQTDQQSFEEFIHNPYNFLDILFVHEPPSSENKCDEVYNELISMDRTRLSYILEVGRNSAKLFNSMAQLIAHPLQRPMQGDVCYSITRITQDSGSDEY